MTLNSSATAACAFLATYWLHSSLVLGGCWLVLRQCGDRLSPAVRLQAWKLAILAPCITSLAVTVGRWPHLGFALPLTQQVVDVANSPVPQVDSDRDIELRLRQIERGAASAYDAEAEHLAGQSSGFVDEPGATPGVRIWSGDATHRALLTVVVLWLLITVSGLARLIQQWRQVGLLRRNSRPLDSPTWLRILSRLCRQMGVHRPVDLLCSPQTGSPLAAGILKPFVVIPTHGRRGDLRFADHEAEAVLAHEVAHVANGDAWWNLLNQLICRTFFFQPLNFFAVGVIRREMDFVADASSAFHLGERTSLARCLLGFAEKRILSGPRPTRMDMALCSGMALFESTLGQRVEMLLDDRLSVAPPSWRRRATLAGCGIASAMTIAMLAPRVVVATPDVRPDSHVSQSTAERTDDMHKTLASMVVATGLALPAAAEEAPAVTTPAKQAEPAPLKTAPDELPAGLKGFNGMLVGRLAAKDAEKGSFTLAVDAVSRVWENSRAESPESVVGKTVRVDGVFGRFLDVLIVTRVGETLEFECKFDDGRLVFPGELLRKVGAYKPENYPVIPDGFRGFRGMVSAEVLKKDPETFEVILQVAQVRDAFDGSRAKDAGSIEGKSMMLVGFWNRREAFDRLKVGATVEVGVEHAIPRSNHLKVIEGVRTLGERKELADAGEMRRMESKPKGEMTDGQRGFRGMLVGRLVQKDVEKGEFTVTVDAVPRVWQNNQFAKPKSLIGKNITLHEVTGRFIDTLVVTRVGDTLQFGALDDGGNLRLGEVLQKVAPVKTGDYPVLPDEFRGFRGVTTAKVVRKTEGLFELVVEVESIQEEFEGNQARDSKSIVGKTLMLTGFWNRKEDFHSVNVGDSIRCGMQHRISLSDHVDVAETFRKLDAK